MPATKNPATITRNVRAALVSIKKSDHRVPHAALRIADGMAPTLFALCGNRSNKAAWIAVSLAVQGYDWVE